MPTENPKISAYVPQIIYDRFKEFKEERKLSFSQAAIEVFAEYFGINLVDNSNKEFTGGLPNRVSQLEQLVADLSEKVDSIQSTNELQINHLPSGSSNGRLLNELPVNTETKLLSEPESELPITKFLIEQQSKLLDSDELLSDSKSEPLDLSPHHTEVFDSQKQQVSSLLSNPLSSSDIKISYPVLALRLGATEGYLKNKKSTSTTHQFTEWSTKKDPDKIGWQAIKEGKKVYHCPVDDLSDEQKFNLQEWLTTSQITVD